MTLAVRALPVLALFWLPVVLGTGCKKESGQGGGALDDVTQQLLNVRVQSTPLELRVPPAWKVRDLVPGPLGKPKPTPKGETPQIKLTGRLLFQARAPKTARASGAAGEWATPRLEIFHDPWLPVGTSAQDYLNTQRQANEDAVQGGLGEPDGGAGAAVSRIRHVEAERSRRQGRPSYQVRDEWTFQIGAQQAVVSQDTLLLIDEQDEHLHGYAVVVTMAREDLKKLDLVRRAVIGSVRFVND